MPVPHPGTGPEGEIQASLKVEYLWWAECPSHEQGHELLQQALSAEGMAPEIVSIEVRTEEEAHRLRFPGSPTIRLNGADIDPTPEPTGAASPYALTCRAYRREGGRIAPLPTLDYIRSAVRRALGEEMDGATA